MRMNKPINAWEIGTNLERGLPNMVLINKNEYSNGMSASYMFQPTNEFLVEINLTCKGSPSILASLSLSSSSEFSTAAIKENKV